MAVPNGQRPVPTCEPADAYEDGTKAEIGWPAGALKSHSCWEDTRVSLPGWDLWPSVTCWPPGFDIGSALDNRQGLDPSCFETGTSPCEWSEVPSDHYISLDPPTCQGWEPSSGRREPEPLHSAITPTGPVVGHTTLGELSVLSWGRNLSQVSSGSGGVKSGFDFVFRDEHALAVHQSGSQVGF